MNTLHRITGRAGKCGPCAISAVTGIPTHDAARRIRQITGKRAVNGVGVGALIGAMSLEGWEVAGYISNTVTGPWGPKSAREFACLHAAKSLDGEKVDGFTVRQFMDRQEDGIWIVVASMHWFAYADGQVADSGCWFSRKPTAWDGNTAKAKRVRLALRFTKREG